MTLRERCTLVACLAFSLAFLSNPGVAQQAPAVPGQSQRAGLSSIQHFVIIFK